MVKPNSKALNGSKANGLTKVGKLTRRQEKFVQEFTIDLNGKQAAIRSGYSPRSATIQGSRLLTYVNVQQAIAERMAVIQSDNEVTVAWVLKKLKMNARNALEPERSTFNGAVANRSLELLGKHMGMYVDRVDHTGTITIQAITRTIVEPKLIDGQVIDIIDIDETE